jgi:hypothetical protein
MVKKAAGGAISVTGPDGRQTGHDHRLIKRTSRANNEETELDELRRSTLGSYATKAMSRGDIASRMSKSDDDTMGKIANKRFAGVKLAAKKIATSAGAGRATATAVGKNVDAAKAAGQGAYSGSNKDREDYGKSYNAAQRGINKLRDMGEESELDEISKGKASDYFHAAEKDSEGRAKRIDRLKSIPVNTKKDQEGLTTLRKGLQKIQNKRTRGMGMAMDKYSGNAKVNATEETELDEISDKLAGNYERKNSMQKRKLSSPYGDSPEDANTLRKREAGRVSLVTRKFNKMKKANEETE